MVTVEDWRPAIATSELDDYNMKGATVGDAGEHKIVVLRMDGEYIAYRDACPHEGFPLSVHAERQDFVIVCNKHLWEFEANTGEHISRLPRPQCNLQRYPTREVDGMVEVNIAAVGEFKPVGASGSAGSSR